MNKITGELLRIVSGFNGAFQGAYNIRENGACAGRQSSENICLTNLPDRPGLRVDIRPGTRGETVYIPACVTQGGVDDVTYNDFYVGEGADVTIIAGCGVHTADGHEARHNGIHRFFVGRGANVLYKEKHVGTGAGNGGKVIDPVTEILLEEGSQMTMDTVQLSGVDSTVRTTRATVKARARLVVRERLLTDGAEAARTDFDVVLEGEEAGADLVSRSVAKGHSRQEFASRIRGLTRCTGHSSCDAILADQGVVIATPALDAAHVDAALIHEAAIGKIAGDQLQKLQTLGLTAEQAEERIIQGFLK